MVKLARETLKGIEFFHSSIICRNDIKDIDGKINETNSYLKNYCEQQNFGFIINNNINKADLAAKSLHIKERGSSKLAKNII